MAAHSPASAQAPRLNPFAFASDTSFRFALLIGIVVVANVYLSIYLHPLLVFPTALDVIRSIEDPKLNIKEILNDPSIAKAQFDQRLAPFLSLYKDLWKTTIGSVALMLGVAWAIYWRFPARKIRREGLSPLNTKDAPALANYLKDLCAEAGLTRHPVFLLDCRLPPRQPLAFGRLRRYYVALPHWLATQFPDFHTGSQARFRAIVLHELAHLRNADVDKTYFAVALWRAFVIVSLPFLVLAAASLLYEPDWDNILKFLALTVWVYLTRNAILRARELYADVRVSVWEWDGLHRLLEEACSHSKGKAWRTLWQQQYHPTPAERLRVLHDTSPLFRLHFWDAMGVGMATAFGSLKMGPWFVGVPIDPFIAVFAPPLIFISLAVGAVGLGAWRGTFAALMRGETPREAGRLGAGLALGFLVGEIVAGGSQYFTPGFGVFGEPLPVSSVFSLLGFRLLWAMLLVGILVLFLGGSGGYDVDSSELAQSLATVGLQNRPDPSQRIIGIVARDLVVRCQAP